jgi:uncharacterized protein YggE
MSSRRRSSRLAVSARLLAVAVLAGVGLLTAVTAAPATAQDTGSVATDQTATVTVLGHGSVAVKPDTATLSIGVSVTDPDLAQAQQEATRLMTKVIAAVKANGVKDDDIQTAYYNVYAITRYDENGNPSGIVSYQVSNQVQVTVRDLGKVESVLEDAVTAGANTIYGVSFGIADPSAAKSQARAEAVADAKQRAEELAAAAGLTLGRVVSMSEGVLQSSPYFAGQGAGGQGGAGPVESGSLAVTVDVQVTYELV